MTQSSYFASCKNYVDTSTYFPRSFSGQREEQKLRELAVLRESVGSAA